MERKQKTPTDIGVRYLTIFFFRFRQEIRSLNA